MTIEEYLGQLHRRRRSLMTASRRTGDLRGYGLLKTWMDIRVCVSADNHRQYWRYAGDGLFICDICERITFKKGA